MDNTCVNLKPQDKNSHRDTALQDKWKIIRTPHNVNVVQTPVLVCLHQGNVGRRNYPKPGPKAISRRLHNPVHDGCQYMRE